MSAHYRSLLFLAVVTILVASSAFQTTAQAEGDEPLAKPSATRADGSAHDLDPADWQPILLPTPSTIDVLPPKSARSKEAQMERSELRAALQSATPHQRALVKKWASANQGKVWRAQLEEFNMLNIAGPPSTLRLYAALQIAIADAEVRHFEAARQQIGDHAKRLQDFESSRMDDAGARGVGAGRLAVDDERPVAVAGKRRGQRQARRSGSDDEDIGRGWERHGLSPENA